MPIIQNAQVFNSKHIKFLKKDLKSCVGPLKCFTYMYFDTSVFFNFLEIEIRHEIKQSEKT